MHASLALKTFRRVGSAITLAFLYLPVVLIVLYALNDSRNVSWP